MFAVEIYAAVRRFVFVEGKSRREAARVFGLSRDTIAKMCRYSAPPSYVRSKAPERPKLGPLVPVIDTILESDNSRCDHRPVRRTSGRVRRSTMTARQMITTERAFTCMLDWKTKRNTSSSSASRRWFGLANARPKRQSQPRNLVIGGMSD
jgi:hypothetical protein